MFSLTDVVFPIGRRVRGDTVEILPWVPNYHIAVFLRFLLPYLKNKDIIMSLIPYDD